MSDVRVRIAPSPTGEDLHIGNVYTALLNFVFAKQQKGKFIVRIEDTDRTRLVPGSEERILSSLKWFGLIYDEGPDVGGNFGPYRQSERLDLYKQYARDLVEKGHAYYCFCTPERLSEVRQQQQEKKMPTMYDGHCKKIKDYESRIKNEKYTIRLNVPDEGTTEFTDLIRGKISFENKLIDDQVLLKSDGYPTYHLGVVVDDHLMDISHVIRAEEWISSTPKHILIYTYLGWKLPIFAHGPVLRNPDRSKLSKRKNPVWADWYRKQGFLPEAILNYLALMGWSPDDEKEIFIIEEMMRKFRLEAIKPVGPAFDIKKLEWMNGEYIRKSQKSKVKSQIVTFYNHQLPENLVEKTIPLIQERIKKLSDYFPLCEFFFKKPDEYEIDLSGKGKIFQRVYERLEKIKKWKGEMIGIELQQIAIELDIKNSEFFMLMRVAITGKKISPPLNESMEILGQKEVLHRVVRILPQLVLATNNQGKIKEIKHILSDIPFTIKTLSEVGCTKELEETGNSFTENAIQKAKQVGNATHCLTFAEDSGLVIDILGGKPGIYSARYARGTDRDRVQKVLEELKGVAREKRTARFKTIVVLYDPKSQKVDTFEGISEGYITEIPRGVHGFGYDPIFFNLDLGKTNGEATLEEKNRFSHRAKALEKCSKFLHAYKNS